MAVITRTGSGGGGGGGQDTVIGNEYYVSVLGDDLTANGSFNKPFATFNKLNEFLFALLVQPSFGTPFVVNVLPGTYQEGDNNGVLYPNCFYFGYSHQLVFVLYNGIAGYYVPAWGLIQNGNSLIGIYSIQYGGPMTLDISAIGGGGHFNQTYMNDAFIDGDFNYVSRGTDSWNLALNVYFYSDCNLNGYVTYAPGFVNCTFNQTLNFTSTAGPTEVNILNCEINTIHVSDSGGSSNTLFMFGNRIYNTAYYDGAGTTVNADVISLPSSESNLTLANSATLNLVSQAYGLGYMPTEILNWPIPTPTNVQQALDALGGGLASAPSAYYYVDSIFGDDSSANGTLNYPFKTFYGLNQFLFALPVQPEASACFFILIAPGVYDELTHNDILYPNCYYIGTAESDFTTIKASLGGDITFYGPAVSTIIQAGSFRIGISYVTITDNNLSFDFVSLGSAGSTSYLDNILMPNNNFIYTNNSNEYWSLFRFCTIQGDCTLVDAQISSRNLGIVNCTFFNLITTGNATTCYVYLTACIVLALEIGDSVNFTSYGSAITAMVIDNANSGNSVDVVSYPNSLTLNGGAAPLTLLSFAPGLGYTPNDSGDWMPAPNNVQDALDQVAARLVALGG